MEQEKSVSDNIFKPTPETHKVISVHSQEGFGHKIEDRFKIIDDLGTLDPKGARISFLGIFDGHGGSAAADFVTENLPQQLLNSKTCQEGGDWKLALTESFIQTDKIFLEKKEGSGCCGIAALLMENDPKNLRVLVANVGDSRAIISRNGVAIPLSTDHKATVEKEKERIKKNGGFVNGGRLYGILAVSRAFGDKDFKGNQGILIAEPEITEEPLNENDDFLLIGCDGLWDVISNQEVVDITTKLLDVTIHFIYFN